MSDNRERIRIEWDPSTNTKLTGYNIQRSTSPSSNFVKINTTLLTAPFYNDYDIDSQKVYYYRIEYVINGVGGTYSDVITGSKTFNSWYIDNLRIDGVVKLTKTRTRNRSKRVILGSRKQVIQDRGFLPEDLSLEIYLTDDDFSTGEQKYNDLIDLLSLTKIFIVKDPFGRTFHTSPGDFEDDQLLTGKLEYLIQLELTEVT